MSDKNIYCDKTTYLDGEYICWYTGEPCTISPIPNKYVCYTYDKNNRHKKERNIDGE